MFYPTSFTLANGLQVIVVPNRLAKAVSQMVWYKVGSSDEAPGKTGLAHYLEHLMFRGTASVAPGDFSKIVAAQGGEDNAFTSYDYTSFHETVTADRLPLVMQMEADRMQNLRIEPETATPELSVVLDERQQRTDNNPAGRFNEKVNHLLMPRYPYGTPVIGWKKDIERLTVADARKFYERHYAPNNAIVIISGDVAPEDVMRLAAAIYGPVPRRDVAPRSKFPPLPLPKSATYTMTDARVEQPQVRLEIVVPSRATAASVNGRNQSYAYEVLSEVLDSGQVGLLYHHLVKDKNLATSVDAYYDADARGDCAFTIAAVPRSGVKVKTLEDELNGYLRGLASPTKTFAIDDESVKLAKDRLERSAIFARDSLMMPGYAFGVSLAAGESVADVENWPEHIDAVTAEDVNAAMRDLVANPHRIMARLLPDHRVSAHAREDMQPVINRDMSIR